MISPWRFIENDSRAVEIATGFICLVMALGSVIGGADWLPWPPLAGAWVASSAIHIYAGTTTLYTLRQLYALASVLVFVFMAVLIVRAYGFDRPGGPAFVGAALVQCWVFFAIESDRVDARIRERRSC